MPQSPGCLAGAEALGDGQPSILHFGGKLNAGKGETGPARVPTAGRGPWRRLPTGRHRGTRLSNSGQVHQPRRKPDVFQ